MENGELRMEACHIRRSFAAGLLTCCAGLAIPAFSGTVARAATLAPEEIIRRALNIFEGVNDYCVVMTLTVQGPNIRVPERRFQLYYKKPDHLKVVSGELVIVPRDAVLFIHRLGDYVTDEANSRFELAAIRKEDDRTFYEVVIRPRQATGDLLPQVTVLVDGDRWTVERMVFSDGQKAVAEMTVEWLLVNDTFWLPQHVVFSAHGIPRPHRGDPDRGHGEPEEFSATLTWSDYQVNIGLSDSFFEAQ